MNSPSTAGPQTKKRSGAFWAAAAVAVWAVVIFILSTRGFGNAWSYKLLDRILRQFAQPLSSPALVHIDLFIRKLVHVVEYTVLTFLLYRILRPSTWKGWHATSGRLSIVGSALYAASDELHQLFVPGRRASVRDWAIDMVGAVLGLSAAYFWTRLSPLNRKTQAADLECAEAKQSKPPGG